MQNTVIAVKAYNPYSEASNKERPFCPQRESALFSEVINELAMGKGPEVCPT